MVLSIREQAEFENEYDITSLRASTILVTNREGGYRNETGVQAHIRYQTFKDSLHYYTSPLSTQLYKMALEICYGKPCINAGMDSATD